VLEVEFVLELRVVVGGVEVLGALVDEVVTFAVLVTTSVLVAAGGLLTIGVLAPVDVVTVLCETARLRVVGFDLCLCFGLATDFADVGTCVLWWV
jgi:hypothetical protein